MLFISQNSILSLRIAVPNIFLHLLDDMWYIRRVILQLGFHNLLFEEEKEKVNNIKILMIYLWQLVVGKSYLILIHMYDCIISSGIIFILFQKIKSITALELINILVIIILHPKHPLPLPTTTTKSFTLQSLFASVLPKLTVHLFIFPSSGLIKLKTTRFRGSDIVIMNSIL